MPELPEVEAARKALFQMCHGRVIVEARVAEDPIVINGIAPSLLQESLTGRTIVDALRKGKNLWLHLDRRPWPSFQFGSYTPISPIASSIVCT
jgi:formamidopyrimidine-DNA glycosylase